MIHRLRYFLSTGRSSYRRPMSFLVRFEDAWVHPRQTADLVVTAKLENGNAKPLFPRIT